MKWPETLLAVLVVLLEGQNWGHKSSVLVECAQWTTRRKLDTRCAVFLYVFAISLTLAVFSERTRELWYHGFNNYMQYGVYFGLYFR